MNTAKAFTVLTGLLALVGGVNAQPADSDSKSVNIKSNSHPSNSSELTPTELRGAGSAGQVAVNQGGQQDSGALGLTGTARMATTVAIGAAGMAYGVALYL